MIIEYLNRIRWEREISEYLCLVAEYEKRGEDVSALVHMGRYIISESGDLPAVSTFYRLLFHSYQDLLYLFCGLEDDGEGDDSGPMSISPGDCQPKTLSQKMRESGYHFTERSYQ